MKELDAGVKWFNTDFFPQKRTQKAQRYEDGVLPRLREPTITMFTPWGPRYNWQNRGVIIQERDKEVETLTYLVELFEEIRSNMPGKKFRWVFLSADLYGTHVNNLPTDAVDDYFASLGQWLNQLLPVAEFRLWSEFDQEAEAFRQKAREDFNRFISLELFARAIQTAQAMKRGSDPKVYLIERLAEAMLIEQILRPIKLSCVGREKDNEVDCELPRLYFLPECLRAPWM